MQEGFRDTWGFRRLQLQGRPSPRWSAPAAVRPLRAADWPELLALDARAFGASRERLLRALAARLPQAALVAEENGKLAGYLLGRDGREARQLGPLVARSSSAARALLAEALAQAAPLLYLDVVDREPGITAVARVAGLRVPAPVHAHGARRARRRRGAGRGRAGVLPGRPGARLGAYLPMIWPKRFHCWPSKRISCTDSIGAKSPASVLMRMPGSMVSAR